jgi:hypothetical protein
VLKYADRQLSPAQTTLGTAGSDDIAMTLGVTVVLMLPWNVGI